MVCKIVTNFQEIKLNDLFDYLNSKGEFVFVDNILYFRSINNNINKNFFINLKKITLNNVYIQEINDNNLDFLSNNSFLYYWIKEGIDNDIKYDIETNQQKELKSMISIINTVSYLIDKYNQKQGGEEDVDK